MGEEHFESVAALSFPRSEEYVYWRTTANPVWVLNDCVRLHVWFWSKLQPSPAAMAVSATPAAMRATGS